MNKVSAVLVSFNEEEKIEAALRSLQGVSDEIIVVDSFSTDATEKICRQYVDQFLQRPWEGYRTQKQFATQQANHEWVLSLDADEVLSPELQREISRWKEEAEDDVNGYLLPRKTYFLGRWIEHTTWYPDWQLRLFRGSKGEWKGGRVHESFKVRGRIARLKGELYHFTYSSLKEYLVQLERFSSLSAADYYDRGVRARPSHLLLQPPLVFVKNYCLRLGFLDGVPGLAASGLSATSTFFKYLKLWELQLKRKADDTPA